MIEFLKKYKEQIFNIITIFLILEFAVFPGLTSANTFSNILAGIALLLLIVWGGLSLYGYIRSSDTPSIKEESFNQKEEFQIKAGIKGDYQKTVLSESELLVLKEIANNWENKIGKEDPLSDIPFSRLSIEAKEKMAKIAKADIKKHIENTNLEFSKIKNISLNKTKY